MERATRGESPGESSSARDSTTGGCRDGGSKDGCPPAAADDRGPLGSGTGLIRAHSRCQHGTKDAGCDIRNLERLSTPQEPPRIPGIAASFPSLDPHVFKLQSKKFFFSVGPACPKTAKHEVFLLDLHVVKLPVYIAFWRRCIGTGTCQVLRGGRYKEFSEVTVSRPEPGSSIKKRRNYIRTVCLFCCSVLSPPPCLVCRPVPACRHLLYYP